MNRWIRSVRDQRGVALPLALFALVMLSGMLLAFLSMAGMEPTISANLNTVAQARYVADAGIEWAFDQLANPATSWNTLLQNNPRVANSNPQAVWLTPAPGGNPTQVTLSGLSANNGTFTVQARNDVLAADQALTGLAPDGNATNDVNQALIVTATGTLPNGSTRQVQVVVRRLPIPTMPGALNCAGLQCDFDMGVVSDWTNHHFHSVGLDYAQDPSNPANMVGVSGNMKYAIATPTGKQANTNQAFETSVENALNKHQLNELDGLVYGSNPPTANVSRLGHVQASVDSGKSTIAADSQLVSKTDGSGNFVSNPVSDFVNMLKAQPGVTVLQSQTGCNCNMIIQDGRPIGANNSLPVNLGTVQSPKITYFKGDPNNTSNPTRLLMLKGTNPGTSGAGILIVEDGTVEVYDNFRWDGVIIVTGKNVGITFKKSVQASVYGGVILNETRKDQDTPSYDLQLEKNCTHSEDSALCGGNDNNWTKMYSSTQRVNQAQSIRSLVRVSTWREI